MCSLACLFHILGRMRLDGLHVYLIEFLNEELAVFRIHDCLDRCTEHFNAIFFENFLLVEFHAAVQCRLTTE